MATEVISTIRASGGDYTTLSAWEAGEQRNLVTADEIATAECYNDWPSGLSDELDVNGWTTDSTRYVRVTVAAGHRHEGVIGVGFHLRKSSTGSTMILNRHPNSRFEWLDVVQQSTAATKYCFRAFSQTGVLFDKCLGKNQTSTTTIGVFHSDSGGAYSARTCVAYDSSTGFAAGPSESFNCIADTCTTGFGGGGGAGDSRNCVAYNCTNDWVTGWTFNGLGTNNASTGTGSPGPNPVNNITSAAFVDAASNDFHLTSGSVLRGAGTNLFSTFTTDIDGDTWPSSGAWDIGYDRFVSSNPSSISVAASNITATGARITATLGF